MEQGCDKILCRVSEIENRFAILFHPLVFVASFDLVFLIYPSVRTTYFVHSTDTFLSSMKIMKNIEKSKIDNDLCCRRKLILIDIQKKIDETPSSKNTLLR